MPSHVTATDLAEGRLGRGFYLVYSERGRTPLAVPLAWVLAATSVSLQDGGTRLARFEE